MSNTFNWKNLPITVQLRAGGGGAPGTVDTPSSQILGKGSFLLISLGTCHRALSLALPISIHTKFSPALPILLYSI
jgi:hypothetical protein